MHLTKSACQQNMRPDCGSAEALQKLRITLLSCLPALDRILQKSFGGYHQYF